MTSQLAYADDPTTTGGDTPSRPVPSRSAVVQGTERFSLNVIEFLTVVVVGPLLIWLCWVNYDQLNSILGTLFGRVGTGRDTGMMGVSASLIGLASYCFYLTGAMTGWGRVLALVTGLALSTPSAWSSILYYAHGTEAQLAAETEASTRFALDKGALESARLRLDAARGQASDTTRAMANVTDQFKGGSLSDIGEINRRQMPGYQSTYAATQAEIAAAQTAYDTALNAARATVSGEGEGPLATALKATGEFLNMESEPMTRATILGIVVSGVGSIILILIGLHLGDGTTTARKDDGDGTGDGGGQTAATPTLRSVPTGPAGPTGRQVARQKYSDDEIAAMGDRVESRAKAGAVTLQNGVIPDRAVRDLALPGEAKVGGGVARRIREYLSAKQEQGSEGVAA